jgi:hypothetical protein
MNPESGPVWVGGGDRVDFGGVWLVWRPVTGVPGTVRWAEAEAVAGVVAEGRGRRGRRPGRPEARATPAM